MIQTEIPEELALLRHLSYVEKAALWEEWYNKLRPIGKPDSKPRMNITFFEQQLKEMLGDIELKRRIIPRFTPEYHVQYIFLLYGHKFTLDYVIDMKRMDMSAVRIGKAFIVEKGATYGMSVTIDNIFECLLHNWTEESIIDLLKSIGQYLPDWEVQIAPIEEELQAAEKKYFEEKAKKEEEEKIEAEKREEKWRKEMKIENLKRVKQDAITRQIISMLQAASYDVVSLYSHTSIRLEITVSGRTTDGISNDYKIYLKIPKQKQRKIRPMLLSYLSEILQVIDDVQYLGSRSQTDKNWHRSYYSQPRLFEEEIDKKNIDESNNPLFISLFNQAEEVLKDYKYRLFVNGDQVRCFIHTEYGWNTNTTLPILKDGNSFALLAEGMKTISKMQKIFHSGFTFSRI